MEISLVFLFFACAVVLILLAKIFQARLLLFGGFFILLFLSLTMWNTGYDIASTTSGTAFNYTLNPVTSEYELSQMYVNRSQVLFQQQNDFTRMLGAILFLVAIIVGLLGAFG